MVLESQIALLRARRSIEKADRRGEFPSVGSLRRHGAAHATVLMARYCLKDPDFLEKVRAIEPTYIAVGTAHADFIFDYIQSHSEIGLRVAGYHLITPVEVNQQHHYGRSMQSRVSMQSQEDVAARRNYFALERELVRRKYFAYKFGRLTLKRDPSVSFVGMYDYDLPENNLFELIITDKNGEEIKGLVRDLHGDADIEGRADKEGILYKKTYRPSTVLDPRQFSTVTYEGSHRQDRIEGTYRFDEDGAIGGPFVMEIPLKNGTIKQVRELREGHRAVAHAKAERQLWQKVAETLAAAPSQRVKPRR